VAQGPPSIITSQRARKDFAIQAFALLLHAQLRSALPPPLQAQDGLAREKSACVFYARPWLGYFANQAETGLTNALSVVSATKKPADSQPIEPMPPATFSTAPGQTAWLTAGRSKRGG